MLTKKDERLLSKKSSELTDEEKEYLLKKGLRLLKRANNLLRKISRRLEARYGAELARK